MQGLIPPASMFFVPFFSVAIQHLNASGTLLLVEVATMKDVSYRVDPFNHRDIGNLSKLDP